MSAADAPILAGIHHLKLPVTDLARSLEWYRSRLGYQVQVEFVEQGTLMGCGLAHPAGGPDLTLRLDPDRARAAAGFDYFAIGVPDKAAIDRLARSIGDLQDIIRTVRAKGASLKATEQPIDTSTAAGKCFLDMLGVFAEFETNLRRERELEGIAKAKAAGVYKGRPASIDVTKVRQLKAKGLGASEIAKALKIGRASVYRVLGERG